ncbi:orexigenic neuropeptide QRFP [Glossophaga mutica]
MAGEGEPADASLCCLRVGLRWAPSSHPWRLPRPWQVGDSCFSGPVWAAANSSLFPPDQMASPCFLSCLLLLPLGTCLPLLDRAEPTDAGGGIESKTSCADPAAGPGACLRWGLSPRPRAAHPRSLLVAAQEPQLPGSASCAGLGFRFGRQEDGSGATGFLPADGQKASSLLGTLAKELNGYSRKKGGFHFRFGRR